jgi:hypothetical protein
MGYEIFTRKRTRTTTPTVSISPLGRIGLNQSITKTLAESAVEYVLLLWDKEKHRMAIRPITKKDSRAYGLSHAKSSTAFSGKTFLDYIGYDYSETRSFPAEWNEKENILEVELPSELLKGSQAPAKLLQMEGKAARSR